MVTVFYEKQSCTQCVLSITSVLCKFIKHLNILIINPFPPTITQLLKERKKKASAKTQVSLTSFLQSEVKIHITVQNNT